jgi:hypothetical protein
MPSGTLCSAVQRDGEHHQPDAAQLHPAGAVTAGAGMLVRHRPVGQQQEQRAQHQTHGNDGGARRLAAEEVGACLDPRQDQRKSRRRRHHAGAEAEHDVFPARGNLADEKCW